MKRIPKVKRPHSNYTDSRPELKGWLIEKSTSDNNLFVTVTLPGKTDSHTFKGAVAVVAMHALAGLSVNIDTNPHIVADLKALRVTCNMSKETYTCHITHFRNWLKKNTAYTLSAGVHGPHTKAKPKLPIRMVKKSPAPRLKK